MYATRTYAGGPGPRDTVQQWQRRVQAFVRLSAAPYPRLAEWYDARIDAWMDTLLVSRGFIPLATDEEVA